MNLVGRGRELGVLRTALDRREASVLRVSGAGGAGVSALVSEVASGFDAVVHRCPPLPDPSQRVALATTLRRALSHLHREEPPLDIDEPSWDDLLGWVAAAADPGRSPLVVVLDDAHRLREARSRLASPLEGALDSSRAQARPWHLMLAGRPGALPAVHDEGTGQLELAVAPLAFRAALPLLPGSTARDKMESYGVFGGMPGVLRHLDGEATLATNIRRLLLSPGGALTHVGILPLERELQTPSRYAAILSALSDGEAEWAVVHSGVTDLTRSGQVAPYLKRLEEMGLVQTRRSLDSSPRSRNRRYRIVDPALAFWYRLANLTAWDLGSEPGPDSRAIRGIVESQTTAVFPLACRQYMEYDAMENLGRNARECGSLWGPHYDFAVAGVLTSGAAFYGSTFWAAPPTANDLRALDAGVRETRYGFGREARLRLLFTAEALDAEAARAVARRHDVMVITVADLAGDAS